MYRTRTLAVAALMAACLTGAQAQDTPLLGSDVLEKYQAERTEALGKRAEGVAALRARWQPIAAQSWDAATEDVDREMMAQVLYDLAIMPPQDWDAAMAVAEKAARLAADAKRDAEQLGWHLRGVQAMSAKAKTMKDRQAIDAEIAARLLSLHAMMIDGNAKAIPESAQMEVYKSVGAMLAETDLAAASKALDESVAAMVKQNPQGKSVFIDEVVVQAASVRLALGDAAGAIERLAASGSPERTPNGNAILAFERADSVSASVQRAFVRGWLDSVKAWDRPAINMLLLHTQTLQEDANDATWLANLFERVITEQDGVVRRLDAETATENYFPGEPARNARLTSANLQLGYIHALRAASRQADADAVAATMRADFADSHALLGEIPE